MQFEVTLSYTLMMLAFAVPGYISVKCKLVKPEWIPAFAILLLYICQPFLSVYSFIGVGYTPEILREMGIVFGLACFLQLSILGIAYAIFVKKIRGGEAQARAIEQAETDGERALLEQNGSGTVEKQARYRVYVLSSVLGNVGFLGVPLLEGLLPDASKAVLFSAVYIVAMNLLSWTIGLTLLSGNKKYLNVRKMILNPPMLSLVVALPLFFTNAQLPAAVTTGITLMAKMTAPVCMLILGMRFATADAKKLFTDVRLYATAMVKLVVFPLFTFAVVYFLPIDQTVKTTMFILGCMPTASVVLNLSELYGNGQKAASGTILMATILSIITIPLLLMLA